MDIRSKAGLRRALVLAAGLAMAGPTAAQNPGSPQPIRLQRPVATTAVQPTARIVPPAEVAAYAPPPSAVVLRAGDTAATLERLPVARRLALPALRAQPRLAVGDSRVDFAPMLANPRALPNVAERLRAQPQLAEVTAEVTEVSEIPQGLVVRSVLGYRLRPGSCSDPARRASLARSGVQCLDRLDDAARTAALSDPSSARYVADPTRRAETAQRSAAYAAQARAEVAQDIAVLRAGLADPAQRAAIDAASGAGTAARLAGLDDAQLEQEVVNAGETRIEQVMFVPGSGRVDPARFPALREFGAVRAPSTPAGPTLQAIPGLKPQALILPPPGATAIAATRLDLEPHVFLTGFTLGREYEWRQRVEVTISWCWVGCKKTYFAELYAGFGYGFGLRFPMRVSGRYERLGSGAAENARLVTHFGPIDGSAADYAATGLQGGQLFDGKELVAQFGAWAGLAYKVPVLGSGGVRVDVGKDFTEGLPPPFTYGQFQPPPPGGGLPMLTKVFDDFDLIGGRANFGVAGGQVFPALKVELHSGGLKFRLRDEIAGTDRWLTESGASTALAVDPVTHASRFSIGDPVYNLGFLLTPGLNARLFVDVAVWSAHWDWPVWFPQVAVQLPPGGVDFACHAGTECTRSYRMGPTGVTTGQAGLVLDEIQRWAADFESRWLPQCTDDICRTGIRVVRLNTTLQGTQRLDADPAMPWTAMAPTVTQAESTAARMIQEGQVRLTRSAGQGWAILAQAVWSKRCLDVACMDRVAALSQEMVQAAVERQKALPDASSLQVQGEIGREFGGRFQAEVDASKARMEKPALPIRAIPLIPRRN